MPTFLEGQFLSTLYLLHSGGYFLVQFLVFEICEMIVERNMSMERISTRAEENRIFVILGTLVWMQKATFIVR